MTGQIDKDAVRALLTGERVLERFGVDGRGTRTITLRECPWCRRTPRRLAVRVNRDTGRWVHHGGGETCRGDAFDLLAAFMGLDARRAADFPRVLEAAAEITGIGPDTDHAELARMRDEHRARIAERDRREAAERAEGEALVPALWEALDRRHLRGERYLRDRGLDPAALRACGDVARFDRDGNVCVQLWDSTDNPRPINIARRMVAPGPDDPKVRTLSLARELGRTGITGGFSTCGSLVGRAVDVDAAGQDVAILTEGVADTLAAMLAFPGCAIVGANGTDRMADVAHAIAPRLVAARGWLLVVAHRDEQGYKGATDALVRAVDAGLVLRESARVVDIAPHKDLADAWRTGWRWTWPMFAAGRGPGGAQ